MTGIAIRVESLGKRYRLGAKKRTYESFGELLLGVAKRPLRNIRALWNLTHFKDNEAEDVFWALRDISFDVAIGDVLGIIGRNGAGKSTLLKILSRITHPTTGKVCINGRVSSLLEVGTGFHPELTGRENVFLNGAILGMSRAEINRRFDEIVEFSGVERFLDTPVKRYSSGMKVRLAFAVAAHLNPEVLIIDEVLAVGDASFQKKCLGKMDEVAREGRTVLFVSHNMDAVTTLCTRAIWLDGGQIVADGPVQRVVEQYLSGTRPQYADGRATFGPSTYRRGNGLARYTTATLIDKSGSSTGYVYMGDELRARLEFEAYRRIEYPGFGLGVENDFQQRIASISTEMSGVEMGPTESGGVVELRIKPLTLMPGTYYLTLGLNTPHGDADWIPHALAFQVLPPASYPGRLPPRNSGSTYLATDWTTHYT